MVEMGERRITAPYVNLRLLGRSLMIMKRSTLALLILVPVLGAGQAPADTIQQGEADERLTGHLVTYVDGSRVRIHAERWQVSGSVIDLLNDGEHAAMIVLSQVKSSQVNRAA